AGVDDQPLALGDVVRAADLVLAEVVDVDLTGALGAVVEGAAPLGNFACGVGDAGPQVHLAARPRRGVIGIGRGGRGAARGTSTQQEHGEQEDAQAGNGPGADTAA